jgi:hypothetical protein
MELNYLSVGNEWYLDISVNTFHILIWMWRCMERGDLKLLPFCSGLE